MVVSSHNIIPLGTQQKDLSHADHKSEHKVTLIGVACKWSLPRTQMQSDIKPHDGLCCTMCAYVSAQVVLLTLIA